MQTQFDRFELPGSDEECKPHESHEEDPTAGENVPATHSVQLSDPVVCLYCPAAHASHSVPFLPVYPALQTQSTSIPLPVPELDPSGHDAQALADNCAVPLE